MPFFYRLVLLLASSCLLAVFMPAAADTFSPLPLDEVVLFDFNDQPLGPVGTGGAALGQPFALNGSLNANIVERGSGRALRIDTAGTTNPSVIFQWPDNHNLTDEIVRISFEVEFEAMDSYIFRVRRAGSFADGYLNLRFSAGGFISNLSPVTGTIGTYSAGVPLSVLLEFDNRAGTVSIALDGEWVLEGFSHGAPSGEGIGRITFGYFTAAAEGEPFEIDNLRVETSRPLGTVLVNDFADGSEGAAIGTGGAALGEPVEVPATVSATFVELDDDTALRVEREAFSASNLVVWGFLDDAEIESGLVFAETMLIMRNATWTLFRLADVDNNELVRVTTSSTGDIYARFPDDIGFGTLIGSYTVGEPFRVGILCDLDGGHCSIALDRVWAIRARDFDPDTPVDFAIGSFRSGFTVLSGDGHAFDMLDLEVRTNGPTGTPASVAFEQQPTDTPRREPFDPPVAVRVLDPAGEPVADGYLVELELEGGGDAFVTNATAATVGGLAVFPDSEISDPGDGVQLRARVLDALVPLEVLSEPFDVGPGLPRNMFWVHQPTDIVAGASFSPTIAVGLIDVAGSPPAAGTQLDLEIADGPAGAVPEDNSAISDAFGEVVFTEFSLTVAGDYRLLPTMEFDGFNGQLSDWFTVHPGEAAGASFLVEPAETEVNVAISPEVSVMVVDGFGNAVADGTLVTLQLASGPAAGLSGHSAGTVNGLAVFPDLIVDQPGSYTLRAEVDGIPIGAQPVSSEFPILPGPPFAVHYELPPSATIAGEVIDPPVVVRVVDASGFDVADGVGVNIALGSAPDGASLSGTLLRSTVDGVAAFDNLSLTQAGSYTLVATVLPDGPEATSPGFTILPAAPAAGSFDTQPGGGVVNSPLDPAVVVSLSDEFGNPVADGVSVTLGLADAPSGAAASGNVASTSDGQASFSNLQFDRPGDYRVEILVEGTALTGNTISDWFNITPGEPAVLSFQTLALDAVAGETLTPAVRVRVTDPFGFDVADGVEVILELASAPEGATLAGSLVQTTVGGRATFADVSATVAGTYTLRARLDDGPEVISPSITIFPADPDSAWFEVAPSNAAVGAVLSPTVSVAVVDAFDNPVANATAVSLELAVSPAGASGTGLAATTSAGLATFPDLSFDQIGEYRLQIQVAGEVLDGDSLSEFFQITAGEVDSLSFLVSPADGLVGLALDPAPVVQVVDEFGNAVADGIAVSLTIASGPGGAQLSGGLATTNGGLAVFSAVVLDQVGSYTLRASADGIDATSGSFQQLANEPAHVSFIVQPSAAREHAPISPPVVVDVVNAMISAVPNGTEVVLEIAAGPPGAEISGALGLTIDGTASFPELSLAPFGSYVLRARAGEVETDSQSFEIIEEALFADRFQIE